MQSTVSRKLLMCADDSALVAGKDIVEKEYKLSAKLSVVYRQ